MQFYKIEPEIKVGTITVQCTKMAESLTQVEVSYEYVGLSKKVTNSLNNLHQLNTMNLLVSGTICLSVTLSQSASMPLLPTTSLTLDCGKTKRYLSITSNKKLV